MQHGWKKRILDTWHYFVLEMKGFAPLMQQKILSDVEVHSGRADNFSIEQIEAWGQGQILALTPEHWMQLSPEQLYALLTHPEIPDEALQRFLIAAKQSAPKLHTLARALEQCPERLRPICETIEQDFVLPEARNCWVELQRVASDELFSKMLLAIDFQFLKICAWDELDHPDAEEIERLTERVEKRRSIQKSQILTLDQEIKALEQEFLGFLQEQKTSFDPESRPWKHISRKRLDKLQALLDEGMDSGRNIQKGSELMMKMRLELSQNQAHLQTLNCQISQALQAWDTTYIEECKNRAILLDKVMGPQYGIVKDIVRMLKGKKSSEMSEEEQKVFLKTATQAKELIYLMQKELDNGARALAKIEQDRKFLIGSHPILLDHIRYEYRVGRFSLELFWRILRDETTFEAFKVLHEDEFSHMVTDYPHLQQALTQVTALAQITQKTEQMHRMLKKNIAALEIEDLAKALDQLV